MVEDVVSRSATGQDQDCLCVKNSQPVGPSHTRVSKMSLQSCVFSEILFTYGGICTIKNSNSFVRNFVVLVGDIGVT